MKHMPLVNVLKRAILSIVLVTCIVSIQIALAQRTYADQPLQKFWAPADPPQAQYKIDARIDLPDIEGEEIIVFRNNSSKQISILAFKWWPLSNTRSIEVSIEGNPMTLLNPEEKPKISPPFLYKLGKPIRPRSKVKIEVKFRAQGLLGPQPKQIRLTNWYPRLWWGGLPTHDVFQVKLDIPSGYALAASGCLNKKTGYYENRGVATFGVYLGKDLKTDSREVEGVLITSLFTEKGSECAQLCLDTAADVVKFYKDWLGFYPFKFLYIIPGSPQPWGGYAFASGIVVIHGQEKFKTRPLLHWKWITAHEIGHQYWGEYVMDNDIPAWLWIGMGIYADREYTIFRNLGMGKHTGLMNRYLAGIRKRFDTTIDIPPAQLKKIKYDHNNVVIHGKGFSVISALECVLGKETFEKIYKKCLKDYGGKRLGYKEFWRICEEVSGENLNWFFDHWVRSNKYLCYKIVSQDSEKEGDKYVSTVKVECLGSLKMPVPVKAVFEDGSTQMKFTNRHFKVNTLRFESQSKLKEAIQDPDKKLAMLKKPLAILPEELPEMIQQLPWSGAGEDALKLFETAKSLKLDDADSWYKLGLALFDGSYYKEAFDALQRPTAEIKLSKLRHFVSLVWMGHLKDLMGKREEALKYYKEALKHDPGGTMQHDQWGLKINRKWVEERLKTPFKWGKK